MTIIFLLVILASAIWFYTNIEDKPACPIHGTRPVRRIGNHYGDWFKCTANGCRFRQWEEKPRTIILRHIAMA